MSNDDNILRIDAVIAKVGLSRATIYNMMKAGTFPKQIKLGARLSGWLESEVQGWIRERARASRPDLAEARDPHAHAA